MPHINHRRGETRRSVHRFQGGLTPYDERPQLAASSIGIDLNLISPTPGHG